MVRKKPPQSQNKNPENLNKLQKYYVDNLLPIVKENLELIKDKLVLI